MRKEFAMVANNETKYVACFILAFLFPLRNIVEL